MRHKRLFDKTREVERHIENWQRKHHTKKLPPKRTISEAISLIFPNSSYLGSGVHKHVFRIPTRATHRVLKFFRPEKVAAEKKAYGIIKRNSKLKRTYAKVDWFGKYFLLQKYGEKARISSEEHQRLYQLWNKYGFTDIRKDNIRKVNGKLKVIDANLRERKR